MGRHKDPDTLAFIDWLAEKGNALGFFVEDEYPLHNNEYFVDLVWKLKKDQDPLITFEIETRDASGVFSNTSKIFGPPSKIVAKPWRHFMIIYKTKLSSGHKTSLSNVLNQHNISLFEKVFENDPLKKNLEDELDTLAYDISTLIQKLISGKTLGESLPLILKGISLGLDNNPIKNPKVSISIRSNEPVEGNIKFNILTETPEGEPTFFDRLQKAQKTKEPFTVESPQLKDLIVEGKSIIPKNSDKAKITIIPKPPIVPVKIVVPRTNVFFDNIQLRLVKSEEKIDHLSSEERNLPFLFNVDLNKETKNGEYQISFEPSYGNVKQSLEFEDFIKALTEEKELQILEPKTNKLLFGFYMEANLEQDNHWYELISRLAYIQEKTKHIIPSPTNIENEDIQRIFQLIRVINTGKEIGTVDKISFDLGKKELERLVDRFENEGKIDGMTFSSSSTSFNLLTEDIVLGPSKIQFPDMKFNISIEELKAQIDSASEDDKIKITLVPINAKTVVTTFEEYTI